MTPTSLDPKGKDTNEGLGVRRGSVLWWLSGPVLFAIVVSSCLFVQLTLYGRVVPEGVGAKGFLVPLALLVVLLIWIGAASKFVSRLPFPLVVATFLPFLSTLPISFGVLGSEAFAREYWIDRSLKVELLLGLPAVVLALQAALWIWSRYRLTWRTSGPLLAVLASGFALRWTGMGWGLPFAYQPEESSIYLRWAMEFALHGQWNPHYFQNPSLLIYLLGVEFTGIFAVARVLQFGQDPGDLYMVFRGEQDLFYGLARLNSVLLGTATLLVVYLIGRRLWNERAGLVAAALLAVNFLHVRNSQYAVNDVPSTFFLVLSFYFALRLAEDGRWRHYLLAGLMAGLAASTKYNAGMVVVSIAAAHWVHYRKPSLAARPHALAKLVASGVVSLGGFVVGTPYSVLDFPLFQQGFTEQLSMGQAPWSGQSMDPTGWQFVLGIVQGAGVVAALLAILGAAALLVRHRQAAILLLSFALPYFLFMSAMNLFFVRWVVPAMPFVALLGAFAVEEFLRARSRRTASWTAVALVVLALLQPAVFSGRLDWLLRQTDTREEANRWAEREIAPGSKVAVEAFSLLDQESLAFRATLQQRDIELVWRATMHDLDYYRRNGFDYLAVSSFLYDRAFAQPDKYADRVQFYQQLDRELPVVATFSPRNDGQPAHFALDDLDTPFWYLFDYDRPGPTVKVYRLSPR